MNPTCLDLNPNVSAVYGRCHSDSSSLKVSLDPTINNDCREFEEMRKKLDLASHHKVMLHVSLEEENRIYCLKRCSERYLVSCIYWKVIQINYSLTFI